MLDCPLHVRPQCGPELRIAGEASVVSRCDEALHEAAPKIGHVTVARVQVEQRRLVAARPRIRWRAAQHLRPVGGQPLYVLRVLARMRERVAELWVGQTARVMCSREAKERGVAPGVLIQRWSHELSVAQKTDRIGVDMACGPRRDAASSKWPTA
jgi:hypothetical protein